LLATDSLEQSRAPYDVDGNPVSTAVFQHDLIGLAGVPQPMAAAGRSLFAFRGVAFADLALAYLAVTQARAQGLGTALTR
jgi:ornithine cyclodeaminase/alanine dehydrogenase